MKNAAFSLPHFLQSAIGECLQDADVKALQTAASELSGLYRQQTAPNHFTKIYKLAYLAFRLPATYASTRMALESLPKEAPPPESLLDLGSGPGTALWAAQDVWPSLATATLLEKDVGWIDLAKTISSGLAKPLANNIKWRRKDMTDLEELPPGDAVILSYALGEVNWSEEWIKALWRLANRYLVLVEPGTPRGFEGLRRARSCLITEGAHIAGPCTHDNECPLDPEDWCHFSVRLDRLEYHRLAKFGRLGYEDEKFSYLIFSRQPAKIPMARVVKRPIKGSGHVALDLCGPEGLERRIVSRKQKDLYPTVRKIFWGAAWPPTLSGE